MAKTLFVMIWLLVFPLILLASPNLSDPVSEIKSNMQQQVVDWNQGNIDAFMECYKNADSTLYISSPIIRGYQNILKRYLRQYPNKEKMGKLSLQIIEVRILSPDYAMAIGKWHLERKKSGNIGGVFTLLYENTSQGWKIVVDHSS